MADQDKASKTEEATPRRLAEAANKGDVPRSQEVRSWFVLATAALLLVSLGRWTGTLLKEELAGFLVNSAQIELTPGGIMQALQALGWDLLKILALPLGAFVIAAIASTVVQYKPSFTFEKIKPDLKKVSPLKGLQRLFSANTAVEFGKTLFKLIVVFGAIVLVVWPDRALLPQMMVSSVSQIVETLFYLLTKILLTAVAILTVIAFADLAWQRRQHKEKLKMTKQEVKDEHKQMEGDPHVRQRLRQIRMERARRRMMAQVPKADVVITNPTHYAVALQYDHGRMNAPLLVAKGVDAVALRIREVAEAHDVPLVENPPVARALHASCELDEEIQPEHYKAVAEIIGYVMRLRRGVQVQARAASGARR